MGYFFIDVLGGGLVEGKGPAEAGGGAVQGGDADAALPDMGVVLGNGPGIGILAPVLLAGQRQHGADGIVLAGAPGPIQLDGEHILDRGFPADGVGVSTVPRAGRVRAGDPDLEADQFARNAGLR